MGFYRDCRVGIYSIMIEGIYTISHVSSFSQVIAEENVTFEENDGTGSNRTPGFGQEAV